MGPLCELTSCVNNLDSDDCCKILRQRLIFKKIFLGDGRPREVRRQLVRLAKYETALSSVSFHEQNIKTIPRLRYSVAPSLSSPT